MRLRSIAVRNYRVHGNVKIDLDPTRTVICGPNESGKSTLMEAAHRALFLRARTSGEVQKGMVSRTHGGHPEVELCLEARGAVFQLVKRFAGSAGSVTLTQLDGPTWSGDEAETRLAVLLDVEASGRGKSAARRAANQWAHLWIWQGCAGKDPTPDANLECAALLARLQDEGGAAVMQSQCDARVAGEIARQHDEIFNRNGEARTGSDFGRALAEERSAAAAHSVAAETLGRLDEAAMELRRAERTIVAADAALNQLGSAQIVFKTALARAATLRAEEREHALLAATAAEKHENFAFADARIRRMRAELEACRTALVPAEAETFRLTRAEADARERDAAAEGVCQSAEASARDARLRAEHATAHVAWLEKIAQRQQLAARHDEVSQLRAALERLTQQIAILPAIDSAGVENLQELEKNCSNAAAALNAMAAGIEIVASDMPVRVGDTILGAGETHILTEEAELAIGPVIRVRIRPGGGTTLGEARRALVEARRRLREELDARGISSVADGAATAAERRKLDTEMQTIRARLDALEAHTIEKSLAASLHACSVAEGEVQRLSILVGEAMAPTNRVEAEACVAAAVRARRDAETNEAAARAARASATRAVCDAAKKLAEHRDQTEQVRRSATDVEAQLRLLLEAHGGDAERAEALRTLLGQRQAAENVLRETRNSLVAIEPERLEAEAAENERAIKAETAAKIDAEQRRAVARAALQRDGTSDPYAELAMAEARWLAARERLGVAQRKAQAIRLLHALFREEQKELADRFTGPLAARISNYLECLFGPGAHALMSLEANAFTGLRLVRPAHGPGAFEFDTLSGGTCEQLAAAVRLAMAEVLAQAHDGSLPIVFDDAFVYSDAERVSALQRMLDYAATRGLQIIVLTCNPANYIGFAGKQIDLPVQRAAGRIEMEFGATGENDQLADANRSGRAPSLRATI
jgi:DNA repair exonuclease SbcCD ATPase subunit